MFKKSKKLEPLLLHSLFTNTTLILFIVCTNIIYDISNVNNHHKNNQILLVCTSNRNNNGHGVHHTVRIRLHQCKRTEKDGNTSESTCCAASPSQSWRRHTCCTRPPRSRWDLGQGYGDYDGGGGVEVWGGGREPTLLFNSAFTVRVLFCPGRQIRRR